MNKRRGQALHIRHRHINSRLCPLSLLFFQPSHNSYPAAKQRKNGPTQFTPLSSSTIVHSLASSTPYRLSSLTWSTWLLVRAAVLEQLPKALVDTSQGQPKKSLLPRMMLKKKGVNHLISPGLSKRRQRRRQQKQRRRRP